MGPDAEAEDTVAGSDCRETAAPEDNVREDETVSGVVAVSDDDDIVDVVDYVCTCTRIVHEAVLFDLEVLRLITCR